LNIGGHADRVSGADRDGQRHSGGLHTLPGLGWLPASLERLFGIVFAPVAWIMGVPWKDASSIGDLLGTRLVLNEFVAFLKLGPMKATLTEVVHDRDVRSVRVRELQSIAIQIGGIGRWRLAGRAIWRGWGCGRSRRGRWRIS